MKDEPWPYPSSLPGRMSGRSPVCRILSILAPGAAGVAFADEPEKPAWVYSADLMRPFWQGHRHGRGVGPVHQG